MRTRASSERGEVGGHKRDHTHPRRRQQRAGGWWVRGWWGARRQCALGGRRQAKRSARLQWLHPATTTARARYKVVCGWESREGQAVAWQCRLQARQCRHKGGQTNNRKTCKGTTDAFKNQVAVGRSKQHCQNKTKGEEI